MLYQRDQFSETGDLHPIDLVETVATSHDWDFDRVGDDQIAMVVEGQWRSYSVTLAWSETTETLRLVCCFEMEPPAESLPGLYELLNRVNDECWHGAFTYWAKSKLMVYRYGLALAGGACAQVDQINHLVAEAVLSGERFYPAFQLVCWGGRSADEAMQIAIAEAYGHA
ncbi:YbjN domain-containing protein [Jannaschia sp. W003]|uniref:YbjN domain-containing protein n=1 Tax=Jannaschia sp. W003 TaxID=2867012 RepID=UPI0021A638E8|nr:YbjN domain-containing protein [Jannaschia sp. W003]UWQ22647.1 YbjN domain-containing protein [Jannaschia sp. W003]